MQADENCIVIGGKKPKPYYFYVCGVCERVFFFCLRVSTGVPAGPLKRDAGNVLLCSLASGVCFPWRHPRLAPHTDSAPMVVGSVVQRQQQEGFLSDLSHHWSFLPDDGKFHHLNQPLSFFLLYLRLRSDFCTGASFFAFSLSGANLLKQYKDVYCKAL